jgi:electron transfer flavoprotein alpha subunit
VIKVTLDRAKNKRSTQKLALIVKKDVGDAGPPAVTAALYHLRGKVLAKLSGKRSGRQYLVKGQKAATYKASAPGEAPASMLGNLRKSIAIKPATQTGNLISGAVGIDLNSVPYARRLEFGGTHRQTVNMRVFTSAKKYFWLEKGKLYNIAPRPYLRPTFREERNNIKKIISEELTRRVNEGRQG